MAMFSVAAVMARATGPHPSILNDLHGVQEPLSRPPDTAGEADQMVQAPVIRFTNHLPPWVLCLPGIEEMVGAILQAALARYYCYISQGPCGWRAGREESGG